MKPFLKWAGNKYRIVELIKDNMPMGKRLIEPFAGSGAVFLNTDYPEYLVADSNPNLVYLFQTLQKEKEGFIEYCRTFFTAANNKPERFYELREEFNKTKDRRLKAALFIYLNKHCFNGLCRYNSNGGFNVPFGKYASPYFPAKEMQYFYEKSSNVEFECSDFLKTMDKAEFGDVVYCDPPYIPLSKTSNFTNYDTNGFSMSQQEQLARKAQELADKGVTVVISNHDTEFSQTIYSNARLVSFDVQRNISCDGKARNKAPELLAVFS